MIPAWRIKVRTSRFWGLARDKMFWNFYCVARSYTSNKIKLVCALMHSRSVDIIFAKQTRRIKEIHDERNGMQDTSTSLFICISLIRMDIYSKSLSQNQSWLRNKKIPNHIHVQVSYITFTTYKHVDCHGDAVG